MKLALFVTTAVLASCVPNVLALYNIKASRDLVRIGQLRYEVYATTKIQRPEMISYVEEHSNHQTQVFVDPMDERGINLVAAVAKATNNNDDDDDQFIGCIRLNFGKNEGIGNDYADFFGISPSELDQSVVLSGFCVRSQHRNTRLTLQLIQQVYQFIRRSQPSVQWAYLTCPKDLLRLYGKLGFVAMPNKSHAFLGNVARLKLRLNDFPDKYELETINDSNKLAGARQFRTWGVHTRELPKTRTSQLVLKASLSIDSDSVTTTTPVTTGDDFKELIEHAFTEAMKIFNGSKTMQLLADGRLTLDQYKSILREVYYYVREDPQIEAMATAYLRGKARNVVKPLLKHAISEVNHEQLALNDLMALGENVDEIPYLRPLPTTMGLIAFAFYQVNYRNPIGHLGYLYFLEFLPTFAGGSLLAALKNAGIPENATSFLQEHVEADVGHNKLMVHFISDLVQTPEDCHAVIHAIQTTAELYAVMLDGAVKTTSMEAHLPDGTEV